MQPSRRNNLIPVSLRLVGSIHGDSNILGLLVGKNGEVGIKARQVQTGDLLVEGLGKNVHLSVLVRSSVLLGPKLNLGRSLVGEGA
jgi:hypothetical protein